MSLDKQYYEALASGDAARISKAKAECVAAGYVVAHDQTLSATGDVKDAPPAVSPERAKAIFEGDAKGIETGKKGKAS